jgi:hypothetical protein
MPTMNFDGRPSLAATCAALLLPFGPGSEPPPVVTGPVVTGPAPALELKLPALLLSPPELVGVEPAAPAAFGVEEPPQPTSISVAPTAKDLQKLIMSDMLTPSRAFGEAYWFVSFSGRRIATLNQGVPPS